MIAQWALVALLGAFDPSPALMALQHADGRWGAMSQVLRLDGPELAEARASAKLVKGVEAVLDDPMLPVEHRVLAARTLARLKAGAPTLARQLRRGEPTPESTVVSRAVAVALRQLDTDEARALLAPALEHVDPEVRATAAAAAPSAESLCARLVSEPWPMVRARIAEGLARFPHSTPCAMKALEDKEPTVQAAAAATLATLRDPSSKRALMRLAGNPKGPVPARAEALVALGALGELSPAGQVLDTHLEKGGIEPLVVGALRGLALAEGEAPLALLRRALGSETPAVWLTAARILVERGDAESLPAIEALASEADARRKAMLRPLIERLRPSEPRGEDEIEDEDL